MNDDEKEAIKTLLLSGWVKEIRINETMIRPWGDGWLIQLHYRSCDDYPKEDLDRAVEDFLRSANSHGPHMRD